MSIRFIYKDLMQSVTKKKALNVLKACLIGHSQHLVILIRIGQSLNHIPLIGRMLSLFVEYFIRIIFSSDISLRASIGPGFVVTHGHDIVIGADVKIGENCRIFNGVTLGNQNLFESSVGNQPTLGSGVIICTGAKLLGAINIGNNAIIGANSVLLQSCPADKVAVGVPARILTKKNV